MFVTYGLYKPLSLLWKLRQASASGRPDEGLWLEEDHYLLSRKWQPLQKRWTKMKADALRLLWSKQWPIWFERFWSGTPCPAMPSSVDQARLRYPKMVEMCFRPKLKAHLSKSAWMYSCMSVCFLSWSFISGSILLAVSFALLWLCFLPLLLLLFSLPSTLPLLMELYVLSLDLGFPVFGISAASSPRDALSQVFAREEMSITYVNSTLIWRPFFVPSLKTEWW